MNAKTPPVPPENVSPKGTGDDKRPDTDKRAEHGGSEDKNLREQGRTGNIHQNTHHQGYQQDR